MKSKKWNRALSSLAGGVLAMVFALVPDAVFAAKTVSSDYTLSADEDWSADGVVTVEEGVNVDLNGHVLYLAGLAGEGSFSTSVSDASFTDLTQHENLDDIVTTYTNGVQVTSTGDYDGRNAFKRNTSWASGTRINVSSGCYPYTIVYDFTTATCINCYKIRCGTTTTQRAPKVWTLSGSNDNETWMTLDTQTDQGSWMATEDRAFRIENITAYRYYKIEFTKSNTSTYLALHYIQYGYIGNQIRIDPSQSAGFAAASNSVASAIDCVLTGGTLPADIDLRGLNRKITLEGDLDLAGHRIFTRAINGSGTLTSSQTAFADLTGYGTPSAAPASNSKFPISEAFDNDTNDMAYWSNFSNGTGVKIDYDFRTATNVNRYKIYNKYYGSSNSRNQKTWIIYGSNDNSTWVELDSRADETFGNGVTRSFDFINENCYRYYRMHITYVVSSSSTRLNVYEIEYGVGADNNGIVVEPSAIDESDTSSITVSSGNGVGIDDLTLTADCDMSPYGEYAIFGTVDLQGNDLTVQSLSGSGTITDSSTSATGTLHVVVASGNTVANTTVSLTGNLKLSKEGAGTLTMTKNSQTYTGGTQVVEGTLTCGANGTATPLASGDITVESDGIFEMNGKNGYSSQQVILNGGTLMNSANIGADDGSGTLCKLALTADSTWTCAGTHYFGLASDTEKTPTIDLNGHTLNVTIASSRFLRVFSTTITNGTFSVSGSGTFISGGSGIEARTVDFQVNCPLLINQALSVGNYESLWTSDNYNYASNTNSLSVYGTFTPTTTYFYGCTLMDGATIDLSGLSDTLSITSDSQYGLTTLSFADDATIYVDVGSRSLDSSSCLLSWTEDTQPSNLSGLSFKRPEGTERVYGIAKQDGGLYYTGAGLIITFR